MLFVFPPIGLVLQAVAQSLPGIFFFAKIRGASQFRSIRRLTLGSVIAALLFAEFFPNLWAFQVDPISLNYSTYLDIASAYPTLPLVVLILIPLFLRESSFLLHATKEQSPTQKPFARPTRIASSRVAKTIGLVLGVVVFIAPTTLLAYSDGYSSTSNFVSTIGMVSLYQFKYALEPAYLYYSQIYYTYPITSFALMLMLSSIRIVFARKLILYYRGIGSAYRTLVIGVIGELLANSPYIYLYLFWSNFMVGPLALPLPFLLILGVLLVKLRDRLTSRELISKPRQEVRETGVWPLTLEEEGIIPTSAQTVKQTSVKVPLMYVVLSRIRTIRKYLQE
ncbi:MAG: hypothetical protein C4K47_04195 [Candidatus Thorarchaeota archaeon]|nr:MAG: hypothetical protein C4K47_04195 [Candidatus Thorarchaeota archaeon]